MKQSDSCPASVLDCFMHVMGRTYALTRWLVMTEARGVERRLR